MHLINPNSESIRSQTLSCPYKSLGVRWLDKGALRVGGLEGWRVGGLEGWGVGGLGGWRVGGLEGWRVGGLEGLRVGGLEVL